jgi:tetratricopeptide (TPR) repeat protein
MTQETQPHTFQVSWRRWAPWVILAVTLLVYLSSFQGVFILDDLSAIRQNQTIRRLWPLSIPLSPPMQTSVSGRPILNLTFAMNYAVSGLRVWSYHLANLLIHAAAALLLYGIVRHTLLSPPLRGRYEIHADLLATMSALIWAVHPLQTESVTYIVQRSESLAGLFYFSALYSAIRGSGSEKSNLWSAAAIVLCALGIGTKELVATAPVVILLYDSMFQSGSLKKALSARKILYLGLGFAWLLLPFVSLGARSGSAGFGAPGYGPIAYFLTQLGVITHYLRLSFWPHPLVMDYAWQIEKNPVAIILPGILLGVLVFLTVRAFFKKSPVGFFGAWFFLILAPTSSILPIHMEVAAERRMYLPLAAVVVLVILLFDYSLDQLERKRISFRSWKTPIFTIFASLCVIILSLLTMSRNRDYRDPERMWNLVLKEQPHNSRACLNLGMLYLERGRKQDAIVQYEKALEFPQEPLDIAFLHANLAHLMLDKGNFDKAWKHFEESMRASPTNEAFMVNFGIDLGRKGRIKEAEAVFRRALALHPNNGMIHYYLGRILELEGRIQEAMQSYNEAMKLKPDWPEVENALSRLSREKNDQQNMKK